MPNKNNKRNDSNELLPLRIALNYAPMVDQVGLLNPETDNPEDIILKGIAVSSDPVVEARRRELVQQLWDDFFARNPNADGLDFHKQVDSGYCVTLKVLMAMNKQARLDVANRVKAKLRP